MRKSLRNIRRHRASRRIRRTNRKNINRTRTTKGGRAFISRLFSKSPRVAPEPSPTTPNASSTFEDIIAKYNMEINTVRTQLTDATTNASKKINDKELPGNNPTQINLNLYKEYLAAILRDATTKLDDFHNRIQFIQDAFTRDLSTVAETDTKTRSAIRRDFKTRARNLYTHKIILRNIKHNVIDGHGSSIQTLLRNLERGTPDPFTGLIHSKQPTLFA